MPDVFISYSRRTLEFVTKLAEALAARGKEVWFDQKKEALEGIPPASQWWEEIKYGIETADNFLFVISPPSIGSPYCNAEIAHALQHEKRLVTVLYHGEDNEGDTLRAIDEAIESIPEDRELPSSVSASITNLRTLARQNWLQVSQVQYVAFSGNQAFDWALDQLISGLDMDLAWVKTHSQLRRAAQLWADNDYLDAYRWPEERLRPIRDMIERVQPDLGELVQDFIKPEYDRLWEQINDPNTHHRDRAAIGDRLDELGDCELRAGVGLVTLNLPELSEEEKARGATRLWGGNGTLLGMNEGYLGLPDVVWLPVSGVKNYQLITDGGP